MSERRYWEFMEQARWYAGKSRGGTPAEFRALGWYTPDDAEPRVRSELVRVVYPGGGSEWYHLPVSYRDRPLASCLLAETPDGFAHDATADPEAMTAILAAMGRGLDGEGFTCHSRGAEQLEPELPPRRYGGEQSNTSVFFGDRAMLKFFRKLEPGRNLDVELHEALAGTGVAAQLYGWIEGPGADLAMLVESLPRPEDGYVLACASLSRGFTAEAAELGRALARTHETLRERLGEAIGAGTELSAQLAARACEIATEAEPLAGHLGTLLARYAQVSEHNFPTQRIHGDFHLGQALHTSDGWRIVDFEGEPMKTMAERRAMDSPWRDVAGLLRSLDYAAATGDGLDTATWRTAARDAFLSSYCEAMGTQPSPLLSAYELDKAVYEVRYELRNRPRLVDIPLSFIIRTLKEN